MFEEIYTPWLICLSLKWRRLSRGASSFMPSDVPHQLIMFVDWMDVYLTLRDLITRFHGGPFAVEHPRGEVLIASMTVSQSYKLSDSHEVLLKHWWPALMVHDRFSDCYQVWRLSCPISLSLLSCGVWASRSGFDLHTHSGSVPAFAQPQKDDKIQCRMGVGSLQALH